MKKPVVLGLVIAALVAVIAGGTWWYQSQQDNGLTRTATSISAASI